MTEVERYISEITKYFKYKPLASADSRQVRKYYTENIKPWQRIEGSTDSLYDSKGYLICNGYDRIVIGDYGAYIEFNADQANLSSYTIPEDQLWRLNLKRYPNLKYQWLTIGKSKSGIKIYYQLNSVKYADYIPGKYYVSTEQIFLK